MSDRREFPGKVRVAAWQRSGGHCEKCTAVLRPGKFRYDHIIPDAFGGEPILSNCQVICSACDHAKTYGKDIPAVAKSNRVRARHVGAKTASRPMPGSKASGLKKRMDGSVEFRPKRPAQENAWPRTKRRPTPERMNRNGE